MFSKRLKSSLSRLNTCLYGLYGQRADFHQIVERLVQLMKENSEEDEKKDADWFCNEKQTGYMLYTDLFCGNLSRLIDKIPYFKDLGVTYVHLMPLFKSPEKENDGGYAVSSYRETDAKVGSIDELSDVAHAFHKNGIRLVVDFVFNHTSDEHEWAEKAKNGDEFYRQFYFIYKDKTEADDWNKSLREIFPQVRRGSFTYVPDAGGWVWTTFNSFQWDLNYSNPEVFLAMCKEMLFLAKLGVDVLRLDALAFVWKQKNTCCENLPKAHTLIKAFQYVAAIACPRLVFKSEAIVHPDEVIKYIGTDECRLSYNPLQMALFWEALATRKTTLLSMSLKKRWSVPQGTAWVNYIRCHDDIGWTFSDEDAALCGISGYNHRQFLNRFYTGRFEGSFACGEPFQLNPQTGDCRVCGTMASLSGLEQAYLMHRKNDEKAELYAEMAVKRICMIYTVLFSLPGIPLLYAGDEHAELNDYSYRNDEGKSSDSRWVHRSTFSKKNNGDSWLLDKQNVVFNKIKQLSLERKRNPIYGRGGIFFHKLQNEHVLCFTRIGDHKNLHVMANFSEEQCSYCMSGKTYILNAYDVVQVFD